MYPFRDPSIVDVAHMQLAPFGHAQSTGNGQFSCQHGVKECDGNVVELCAMGLSQWNFSSYVGCFLFLFFYMVSTHASMRTLNILP